MFVLFSACNSSHLLMLFLHAAQVMAWLFLSCFIYIYIYACGDLHVCLLVFLQIWCPYHSTLVDLVISDQRLTDGCSRDTVQKARIGTSESPIIFPFIGAFRIWVTTHDSLLSYLWFMPPILERELRLLAAAAIMEVYVFTAVPASVSIWVRTWA